MTIAPELPNAEETIAHATKLGVRVSLGHSDANGDEARAGVMAGALRVAFWGALAMAVTAAVGALFGTIA